MSKFSEKQKERAINVFKDEGVRLHQENEQVERYIRMSVNKSSNNFKCVMCGKSTGHQLTSEHEQRFKENDIGVCCCGCLGKLRELKAAKEREKLHTVFKKDLALLLDVAIYERMDKPHLEALKSDIKALLKVHKLQGDVNIPILATIGDLEHYKGEFRVLIPMPAHMDVIRIRVVSEYNGK